MTARWLILLLLIGVQIMATASFTMLPFRTLPKTGNSNTMDKRQPLSGNTGDCQLARKDNFTDPMLVIKGQKKLVYPVKQGLSRVINIQHGTVVTAGCPGPNNIISANAPNKYIDVTCISGQLKWNEREVDWNNLTCSSKLTPTMDYEKATDPTLSNIQICSLNWKISPQVIVTQYESVIDTKQKTTLYTKHTLYGQRLGAGDSSSKKSKFKSKFFEGVNKHYTNWNKNYAQAGSVISRGHLAPNGDFVLRAEKDATYFLVNAVPQWEKLNKGVWEGVEQDVRKRNTELEVWTGTYGVLERPQPMFLNKNTVPVPAYIWKMIYDREKKSTDIIVLVNDITGNGTLKGAKLNAAPFCTDKNENCACFPCPIRNVREEQIFCCDANVLRNTIKYLPTVPAIPKDGLRSY